MSVNSGSEQDGDVKHVGFSLGRWRRLLCSVVGLALLVFAAVLAFDGRDSLVILLALALGALFFVLGLFGEFGAIDIPTGGGKSIRIEPPGERPQTTAPSAEQPSPPPVDDALETPNLETEPESERAAWLAAIQAWFRGDSVTFDKQMLEAIKRAKKPDTALNFQCMRLAYLYGTGQTANLEELRSLQTANPSSRYPIQWIGYCYEAANDWTRAAESYERFYDLAPLSQSDRVRVLLWLSKSLRMAKKFDEAYQHLEKGLSAFENDSDRAIIHVELAGVHQDAGRQRERFWHFEQALILNPGDVETRFKLAYAYAESNEDLMALHHYEIVDSQRGGGAELNNLAIIYRELELPITSVRHYRMAISTHYTLASANLARNAGHAGFVDEAKKFLEDAQQEKDIDPGVHSALGQLAVWADEEATRVERVKGAARRERELFLELYPLEAVPSEACTPEGVQGVWSSNLGDIVMRADGDVVKATFKDGIWDWTTTGRIEGRMYRFDWTNDHAGQNKEGTGYLIFQSETTFKGVLRHSPRKGELVEISATAKRDLPTPPDVDGLLKSLYGRTT